MGRLRRWAVLVSVVACALVAASCGDDGGAGPVADAGGADVTGDVAVDDAGAVDDIAAPDAVERDTVASDTDDFDVPPDVHGDTAANDVPELDVSTPDVGGDVPSGDAQDGDVPCVCDTSDACCDGCQPRREGESCAHAAPCVTPGVCEAGVCVGGGEPVVCDPPGPCQTSEGVCSEDSGVCEYDVRPDGTPCAAADGVVGSGTCGGGLCVGFGDCDHRSYGQPTGYPCNFDAECASGLCVDVGNEWSRFCSQACGDDTPAPCPEGTFCVNPGGGAQRHCRPLDLDTPVPGDASQPLFHVCNADADCADGLCLAIDGVRFCTGSCESVDTPGTADDSLCGGCGRCRDNGDDLGFIYPFYCTPGGSRGLGEPCSWAGDCSMRFCQGGYCSDRCFEFGGVSNCPDHMACAEDVLESSGVTVCVPLDEVDRELGETCAGDYSCVDGLSCLEVLGTSICTFDCAGEGDEELACPEGECVEWSRGEKACVPVGWLGAVEQGGRCDADFQCADDGACFQHACLVGCASDDDCGALTCTPDHWYQVAYCAPVCATDDDCPERLTCFEGACVLSADGRAYVNSTCRADADCRTGLCIGGVCTDTCSETTPCEGSVELPVPEWGLCKPCDPNSFGMDCDEDWGFSECIQGLDGAYFCAPDCFFAGEGACPVGSRCYSTGGYSAVCAPISGSCTIRAATCSSAGVCRQPVGETMPCEEDADCGNGACVAGRCEGAECAVDADCGCAQLACGDGVCIVADSAGLAEVEPNDDLADAHALAAAAQTVLGTLVSLDAGPDVDWYAVPLVTGEVLDVWTSPFCGQRADTYIRFFAADGEPIADWAFDSIDPSYPFSILTGYEAPEDGDVLIEVTQGGMVLGNARVNYVLDVNVFTPAPNDVCEDAVPLVVDGEPHGYDLATANGDTGAPSCTGTYGPGKDMAFSVEIPSGHLLTVRAETPFDSQLFLVSDCGDPDGSCVAGADVVWEGGPERLAWANETDSALTMVLVVDSFLPQSDMTFLLEATVEAIAPVANDSAETAVVIEPGTTAIEGSTVGATDTYDGGDEGCVGTALPGRDAVWSVELAPGAFVTVDTEWWAGANPVLLLTHEHPSRLADADSCLDFAQGMVQYRNLGVETETVYLVVDAVPDGGYSVFGLTAYVGTQDECFGPCVPQTATWSCVDGAAASLCWCDGTTGTMTPFDCDAYCMEDGASSGSCHTFTAAGHEGDSCKCDYDCSLPNDHCERRIYTKCTCAAADPCGWAENGGCDDFCAVEYPDDHFDDTVDCAAE